jgi:hypothetical protein
MKLRPNSRLEEVTRQLDRIKRAQSYQDDPPLSPAASSLTSGGHIPTPGSIKQEAFSVQLDLASAFGLDLLDNEASQVSARTLEGYYLSGIDIARLFRMYARQPKHSLPEKIV